MGKRMDEVLQKLIDVNNSVTFIGALLETNLEKRRSCNGEEQCYYSTSLLCRMQETR